MSYTATLLGSIGLSGGDSIRLYSVSPDAATGDITISDVAYAYPIGIIPLIEDSAANSQVAVQALKDVTTHNNIDFKLWQAANSAAATNFKDFQVTVLCKETAI